VNKVYESADAAVADMFDGMTLMAGGFGLCGNPENLIAAIHRKGVKDISLISNNCGTTDLGLGILLRHKKLADRGHADFLLRLVFFVTLPLLILNSVSRLELNASTALLPVSNALVNLFCLGVALLFIRAMKLAKPQAGAVVVNTSISNNSYMFPFVLAVYGQAGFAEAILYDFGNAVMMATLVYAMAFRYGRPSLKDRSD